MCKSKTIIILIAKFIISYHTVVSYTLLQNFKYNLEHVSEGKRLFDLLYGVYCKQSLKISTSL